MSNHQGTTVQDAGLSAMATGTHDEIMNKIDRGDERLHERLIFQNDRRKDSQVVKKPTKRNYDRGNSPCDTSITGNPGRSSDVIGISTHSNDNTGNSKCTKGNSGHIKCITKISSNKNNARGNYSFESDVGRDSLHHYDVSENCLRQTDVIGKSPQHCEEEVDVESWEDCDVTSDTLSDEGKIIV